MEAVDNQQFDDAVFDCILKSAKPTVTLTQLRPLATVFMEEHQMKMAIGRLWRSVKIFRSAAANGQVLYWTSETARAVAASGVKPDMPPGVEIPEIAQVVFGAEEKRNEVVQPNKAIAEVKKEINKVKSRGLLVPVSQTAALPMRPTPEGVYGGLRRGGSTAKVGAAMFKYRDVMLSIDACALICPDVSREDVARVLGQLCTGYIGKDYFIRIPGENRRFSRFQWNPKYCYPFSSREADDGKNIPIYNADGEVEDDQPLDHLPPEQLTEEETESEIARLLREQTSQQTATVNSEEESESTEEDSEEPDESESNSGGLQDAFVHTETKSEAFTGTTALSTKIVVPTPVDESFSVNVTPQDEEFRAGLFSTGELVLYIGNTRCELTKQQTEQVINLIGPHYIARKAA